MHKQKRKLAPLSPAAMAMALSIKAALQQSSQKATASNQSAGALNRAYATTSA